MSPNTRPVRFAYTIMVAFMILTAAVLAVASASVGHGNAVATIDSANHERTAFYAE